MRTVLLVTIATLLFHASICPAYADFVLRSGNPTPQGTPPVPSPGPGSVTPAPNPTAAAATSGAVAAPSGISATPLPPPATPRKPINLLPQSYRVPIAHGFGHEVPLSFAVRQIVPSRLHVAYANQVNPSALVSWKGGQPWNVVLVHAVQPLGYRVWVSSSTVHIYH